MKGRKRGFRGPLGLPIEVSTARAMSNAIINYPVVVRCYRTCASPSLSSFLISVPAFSFTWLHSASIFLFGGLFLSPFSLSSPASWHPASRSRLTHVDSREEWEAFDVGFARTDFRPSIFTLDTRITSPLSSIWHYACLAFSQSSGVECLAWKISERVILKKKNTRWVRYSSFINAVIRACVWFNQQSTIYYFSLALDRIKIASFAIAWLLTESNSAVLLCRRCRWIFVRNFNHEWHNGLSV